jgi:hypothetical protein
MALKPTKMYWFELPLWALLARFGRRLTIKMDVLYDDEVGVYVGTSKNMFGLVCEADTMEELKAETERVIRDLAALCLRGKNPAIPILEWPVT